MTDETTSPKPMRIAPVGHALSLFLLISYVVCIGFGLAAPASMRMHEAWAPLLPGFEWLTVPGFIFGLIGAYLYGWYTAIVFVPLYRKFTNER